jgi:Protein of unknown function (DUF3309)
MQNIFLAAMNDGVPGIVSTLTADHDIGGGREHVDDIPLPFVTPLRADQDRVGHDFLGKILSRCTRSRHSGLASQDKSSGVARKTILDMSRDNEVSEQNMRTILLIILVLLLIGALPTWPYSSGWGYYPGGGLLILIILILVLWRA